MQAQYIVPMAISLGFGIVFATSIILLLVPCLYLILEDLLRVFGQNTRRTESGDPSVRAAAAVSG